MINLETKLFILEHESDDLKSLALQAKKYPQIDFKLALDQIKGRQIAKQKIPSWYNHADIVYPPHLSMEQCSSEKTALYKASLCKGETLIDLTGGFGIDFSFMAEKFEKAIYVETQSNLVELAKHNFKVLGQNNVQVLEQDSVQFLNSYSEIADAIFIDPARRNTAGRKTVSIEDCTPNLIEIDSLLNLKAKHVIIKLSPMLDITLATQLLTRITDIHVISVNNECKELLFVKQNLKQDGVQIHCVNLLSNGTDELFSFTKEQEGQASITYTEIPKKYLYEPNNSIMKAGAYKSIANTFNLNKLHPNSHLYTSDELIKSFPGRVFIIKDVLSGSKKDLTSHLKLIKQANISTRNYPLSVDDLRKQTKLKDGGIDYIFATTLLNEKKVLILCDKLQRDN